MLVVVSSILGLLLLGCIVVGLSELDPQSQLWQLVKSVPGLVQRALAGAWLAWLLASGILMRRWKETSGAVAHSPRY